MSKQSTKEKLSPSPLISQCELLVQALKPGAVEEGYNPGSLTEPALLQVSSKQSTVLPAAYINSSHFSEI